LEIDEAWKDGRLESAMLKASLNGSHKIRPPRKQQIAEVRSGGQAVAVKTNDDGTVTLDARAGQTYNLLLK